MDAGGHSQKKTSLKIVSQRNGISRDRDTLVVIFGHINFFETSKRNNVSFKRTKKGFKNLVLKNSK